MAVDKRFRLSDEESSSKTNIQVVAAEESRSRTRQKGRDFDPNIDTIEIEGASAGGLSDHRRWRLKHEGEGPFSGINISMYLVSANVSERDAAEVVAHPERYIKKGRGE